MRIEIFLSLRNLRIGIYHMPEESKQKFLRELYHRMHVGIAILFQLLVSILYVYFQTHDLIQS